MELSKQGLLEAKRQTGSTLHKARETARTLGNENFFKGKLCDPR